MLRQSLFWRLKNTSAAKAQKQFQRNGLCTLAATVTTSQETPCANVWGLLRSAAIQLPSCWVMPEPGHTRDLVSRTPSLRLWRSG